MPLYIMARMEDYVQFVGNNCRTRRPERVATSREGNTDREANQCVSNIEHTAETGVLI